ncbi:hypothetical protein AM1_1524 [Acaryochloris marina MBIC11017]|uniref:Uncharacterized protein n=2 Tax=Acaryochloris marina TaxID=155978 RepID=B0C914_ACAM1|nr:hypothetical protein AM1_1524 [Acaryochloris marina MBIC11017]
MNRNNGLSRMLLTRTADLLETMQSERGTFNHMAARYAGNASRILQMDDLAERFLQIGVEHHANTKIPRIGYVPVAAKQLDDLKKIDQKHPIFSDDYIISVINASEKHLLPCLSGNYPTAFSHATNQLQIEEIILMQAICGDTHLALQSISRLSNTQSQANVNFVVAIELFRHGKLDQAHEIYNSLSEDTLDIWRASQMALGIANRVPWAAYPFHDF